MADFCNQCAKDMGMPPGDMEGITKPEDFAKGLACMVICQDCGPIFVCPEGNCISDCDKHHSI